MKKTVILSSVFVLALIASGCGQTTKAQAEENINHADRLSEVSKITNVPQLSKGVTYEGEFKDAIQYSDTLGEHIALISEKKASRSIEYGNILKDAELFAYHFDIKEKDTIKQTWKVYDSAKNCIVAVAADFVKNTFQVTDLDNNGIAETWLVYITGCKGDVSPWKMRIIMYEGKQKFTMKGEQKIIMEGETFGGEYTFDNAFNKAPQEFRDFAIKLWNENSVINYDKK